MKKNENNIIGYIEGYYGRLLSWKNRKFIIKSLHKNKMNTYFYAPKEDIGHRLFWRKKYSQKWRQDFYNFTEFAKRNQINIIAGIAPGLDFNFKESIYTAKKSKNSDFQLLLNKAKQLLSDGATSIALLLDDIPDDFKKKFGVEVSEGRYHGLLANRLSNELGKDIFFVPRIYADELIKDEPSYLNDLSKILDSNIKIFYCGKNVVAKTVDSHRSIKKLFPNEIIIWDNFYGNDYCPRRFFIGPLLGRRNIKNIMINPTGLIKTDLLILDIFGNSFIGKLLSKQWEKIIDIHGIPKEFLEIKKFFLAPDFGPKLSTQLYNFSNKDIETLDFLLWKWKGKLSREWYPFLFGLKQDLQINKNLLTSERIVKTQTIPLSKFINKGDL